MISGFFGKYRFLSNFYPCEVVFEGRIYPTVEHAYQAAKTLDEFAREIIRKCETAGQAKRMGKQVRIRKDWEKVKLLTMFTFVKQKFWLNKGLRDKLLATEYEELIETNTWYDTFWGVCNNVGENHLGKILMKVREELR